MRKSLFISFLVFVLPGYSQSGFFGAFNSFEFKISTSPIYHYSYKLDAPNNVVHIKHKYGYLKYALTFSRIVSEHSEISFGYSLNRINANMRSHILVVTDTVSYGGATYIKGSNVKPIDDLHAPLHGFSFDYRFYRLGSRAPVGKFIGVAINGGFARLNENTPVYTGGIGVAEGNVFTTTGSVLYRDTTLYTSEINYSYVQLAGTIGRNYVLSKKLSLSLGMTLPVWTVQGANGTWKIPIPLIGEFLNLRYYYFDKASEVGPDYNDLFVSPIRRYLRINLTAGLKFHF